MYQIVHIHPRCPGLQPVRHSDRPFIVFGVDRRRKAVARVVGCSQRLRLGREGDDADYGAEDFVAHDLFLGWGVSVISQMCIPLSLGPTDLHVGLHVCEYGRLDMIPLLALRWFAT